MAQNVMNSSMTNSDTQALASSSSKASAKGKPGRPKKHKDDTEKAPKGLTEAEVAALCDAMAENLIEPETAADMLEIPQQRLKSTMSTSRSRQATSARAKIKSAKAKVIASLSKASANKNSLERLQAMDQRYQRRDENYVRAHILALVKILDEELDPATRDRVYARLVNLGNREVYDELADLGYSQSTIFRD